MLPVAVIAAHPEIAPLGGRWSLTRRLDGGPVHRFASGHRETGSCCGPPTRPRTCPATGSPSFRPTGRSTRAWPRTPARPTSPSSARTGVQGHRRRQSRADGLVHRPAQRPAGDDPARRPAGPGGGRDARPARRAVRPGTGPWPRGNASRRLTGGVAAAEVRAATRSAGSSASNEGVPNPGVPSGHDRAEWDLRHWPTRSVAR